MRVQIHILELEKATEIGNKIRIEQRAFFIMVRNVFFVLKKILLKFIIMMKIETIIVQRI